MESWPTAFWPDTVTFSFTDFFFGRDASAFFSFPVKLSVKPASCPGLMIWVIGVSVVVAEDFAFFVFGRVAEAEAVTLLSMTGGHQDPHRALAGR